jgi:hypothetical protein
MGCYGREARLTSGTKHDVGHAARGQRAMRSAYAQKHLSAFAGRPATQKVGDDGRADVDRQRQAFAPITLAPHNDPSAAPVDVS